MVVKTCTSKFALCEPLGCSDMLLLMCQSWERGSHEVHDHGLPVCPAIHLSVRRKLRTEKGSRYEPVRRGGVRQHLAPGSWAGQKPGAEVRGGVMSSPFS